MKNILYILTVGCLAAMMACSYADRSTEATTTIPDIIIDTTGIPDQLSAFFGEILIVEPKVSCESNPEKDFSYEWWMSNFPEASTSSMSSDYEIIGTEEYLNFEVDRSPNETTYQLWYRVTDNKTRQMRSVMWKVFVDLKSGQGLLVAHSSDGITSDLSLIQDSLFTQAFKDEDTPTDIKRNLYSQANGTTYPGIIKELTFLKRLEYNILVSFVDGHTGNHMFRINTLNYELYQNDEELFLFTNPTIDIKKMIIGDYLSYPTSETPSLIWNCRGFQIMIAKTDISDYWAKVGYGIFSKGSPPAATSEDDVDYDPDPILSWGSTEFMFYDLLKGRFLSFPTSGYQDKATVYQCVTTGTGFDPTDIKGLEIIAAGFGDNLDHRFLVKQEGEFKILTILQSPRAARASIDVNKAPDIEKAQYFVFCTNQPVLYYATSDNKIYSVVFLDGIGTVVNYRLEYTSPEPINGLYLLRASSAKTIEYDHSAIIMTTTTSQSEGKVSVIPMGTIGYGDLLTSDMVTFGGFARISTVAMVN